MNYKIKYGNYEIVLENPEVEIFGGENRKIFISLSKLEVSFILEFTKLDGSKILHSVKKEKFYFDEGEEIKFTEEKMNEIIVNYLSKITA